MKTLKIGGVPEHFNYPWYLTLKDKKYADAGINLRWQDYYGGTGQMCKALRNNEIDIAVILTEGIVRDIDKGNPSKIVQVFVQSPLLWGIHVAANSTYQNLANLKGTAAAISRFGSGSHLMAYVNALNLKWDIDKDLKFEVIGDLVGALKSLPKGIGDYFMWEKFTTKPFVDNGIFRYLGNCPTPWPCFVIAVRNEILETEPNLIQKILEIINTQTREFKNIEGIDTQLAQRYQQKVEDIREWLSLTEWSQQQLTLQELETILNILSGLGLVKQKSPLEKFLHKF